MDDAIYSCYKTAGKIASQARDYGIKLVKEGVCYLEVVNDIESKILKNGAKLAFPVNISINDIAAHFTPSHNDVDLVFRKGDVVKVDVGAHIDGYIADTAATCEIGNTNYSDMLKASREALDNAIGLMKANVNLLNIGKVIKDTIESYGFKSIDNLTGHSLERYNLHSGLSVPNVPSGTGIIKPKVDDVLAIEPFATDGEGHVTSGNSSNIYISSKSIKSKFIRDSRTRLFAMKIRRRFNTLPFAERWCADLFSNTDIILKTLICRMYKTVSSVDRCKKWNCYTDRTYCYCYGRWM